MDITICDIILKIAQLKNLTRTAEHFGYTPSWISQILKSAEEECGLTLFHRGKTGLVATRECEVLLPVLEELLRSERRLQEQLYQLKHMQTGTIRIGAFTSLSCHWLPQRLKGFNELYPNIRYELKLGDSAQIADWTRNDKIDLGLVTDPQADDLQFIQLMEDAFSVILPEDHPLAKCAVLSLDQLQQERFIFLEPEDNQAVEDWMARSGFVPHIQYRVKDDYTIMSLVESGLGISILPNLVLSRMPYRVHAAQLLPPCTRQIGIILPKNKYVSPKTRHLISFWKQEREHDAAKTTTAGAEIDLQQGLLSYPGSAESTE